MMMRPNLVAKLRYIQADSLPYSPILLTNAATSAILVGK